MADNSSIDSEKAPAAMSEVPDNGAETSSDEATSTKSSEVKTPDDVDTLVSLPSLANPVCQDCKGEDSSRSQSSLSSTADPPEGNVDAPREGPVEEDALLPRRRVNLTPQDDSDEIHERVSAAEHPLPSDDLARRSPTVNLFSSLTRTFENSTDYVANFFCGWQAYSIFLSDSIYLLPVQIMLIAVSVSAVYFGAAALKNCPIAPDLPVAMITLGVMGITIMLLRIIYVFTRDMAPYSRIMRKVIFLMNCLYFITLCLEFLTNLSTNWSDDSQSESFCDPIFRKFILIYNCAAFTVTLLSLALHGPAYLFNSWKIGGPGFPDFRA